ncbi:MAG: hypothetical protein WCS52_01835 [bacterium]
MKLIDLFTVGEAIGFTGLVSGLAYIETHGGGEHPNMWILVGLWVLFGFNRAKGA